MGIDESLGLLGFSSLDQVTEDTLKKQYKRAALKAHPDVGGSNELMQQVYEARDMLDRYCTAYKAMQEMQTQSQMSRCVIDIVDFIGIMQGDEKEVVTQNGIERLRYSNLKGFQVYVTFKIRVNLNKSKEDTWITKTELYKLNNEFDVALEIPDNTVGLTDGQGNKMKSSIEIKVADKELHLDTPFEKLKIPMVFPGKLKVNMQIHRVKPESLDNKKHREIEKRMKINF